MAKYTATLPLIIRRVGQGAMEYLANVPVSTAARQKITCTAGVCTVTQGRASVELQEVIVPGQGSSKGVGHVVTASTSDTEFEIVDRFGVAPTFGETPYTRRKFTGGNLGWPVAALEEWGFIFDADADCTVSVEARMAEDFWVVLEEIAFTVADGAVARAVDVSMFDHLRIGVNLAGGNYWSLAGGGA